MDAQNTSDTIPQDIGLLFQRIQTYLKQESLKEKKVIPKVTHEQYAALVEFMESHGDLSHRDRQEFRWQNDKLWHDLTEHLNSLNQVHSNKRMSRHWKATWRNMKSKADEKLTTNQPLTDLEERIIAITRRPGNFQAGVYQNEPTVQSMNSEEVVLEMDPDSVLNPAMFEDEVLPSAQPSSYQRPPTPVIEDMPPTSRQMPVPNQTLQKPEQILPQPEQIQLTKSKAMPPRPEHTPPRPKQMPPRPEQMPPQPKQMPPRPEQMPPRPEQTSPRPNQMPPRPEQMPPRPEQTPLRPKQMPPRPEQMPPQSQQMPPQTDVMPSSSKSVPPTILPTTAIPNNTDSNRPSSNNLSDPRLQRKNLKPISSNSGDEVAEARVRFEKLRETNRHAREMRRLEVDSRRLVADEQLTLALNRLTDITGKLIQKFS